MLQIISSVLIGLGIYELIYFLIDLIVGDSSCVRGNTNTTKKD
jgi:hypothetical protein